MYHLSFIAFFYHLARKLEKNSVETVLFFITSMEPCAFIEPARIISC